MPLVGELTNCIRFNLLKRLDGKLFDFRADPAYRETFKSILSDTNLHYEQMVGVLEDTLFAGKGKPQVVQNVTSQILECIQLLLLEDQVNTSALFASKVKDYVGIAALADQQPGLHVFSLNHDVNFEEICKYHGVPYRDGFGLSVTTGLRRSVASR